MDIDWSNPGWIAAFGTVGTLLLAVLGIFFSKAVDLYRRPWLQVTFENRSRWVRVSALDQKAETWGIFFRVCVMNRGRSVARNVRGRLDDVLDEHGRANPNFDPFMLHWAGTSDRSISGIDLFAKQVEFVDVFWVRANDKDGGLGDPQNPLVHLLPQDPTPRGSTQNTRFKGQCLTIRVAGENVSTVGIEFRLPHAGDQALTEVAVEHRLLHGGDIPEESWTK